MIAWTWNNVVTTPQRLAARWLRCRGWVVFYLDEQARVCRADCWLRLYLESEAREKELR